jgi:hypothetical protein
MSVESWALDGHGYGGVRGGRVNYLLLITGGGIRMGHMPH